MIADLIFFFLQKTANFWWEPLQEGGNVRQKNRRGKEKGEGEEGERE